MPKEVSQRIITTVSEHIADPATAKNAHTINEIISNILLDEGYYVDVQTGEISVYQQLTTVIAEDRLNHLRFFHGSRYI
jgi:hypothetical protein